MLTDQTIGGNMAGPKDFAGVARAPFLLLPPTLVASGAAAAAWDGSFSWLNTMMALVGLVALHMAVNILNEWSDMRTGIDLHTERTPFSGGSGTLPNGGMGISTALGFGLACATVGLAVGLWFIVQIGSALVPIMILGAICVLAYTDFLARIGVGEMAAGFGLGAGPVIGTALVQDGSWSRAAIAASIPAFLMTFNLLLLNEFPDEEADRKGGRRNLIILFGRRPAARIYAAAAVLTPISIALAVAADWLPAPALLGTLSSLLLVKPIQWSMTRALDPVPIPALGANVAWNLLTNTLIAVGLVVAILMR
jgi:1,4-dihydroxy-2-naphthoate octaprenyltransferase